MSFPSMTLKFLPAAALSLLLLLSGCVSNDAPLGMRESKWLGQMLSVKIVEQQGDMKVYHTLAGVYYYFKNGVLVYKSEKLVPLTVAQAGPIEVPPPVLVAETTVRENVTRPTLGTSQVKRPIIKKPEQLPDAFARAFNDGDLDQLLALYESQAVLAPVADQRKPKFATLRAALLDLLDRKGSMKARTVSVTRADNIALIQAELRFAASDKKSAEEILRTTEVVRQQADGSWLYVIAQPLLPE